MLKPLASTGAVETESDVLLSRRWQARALGLVTRHAILLTLIVVSVVFSVLRPDTFFTRGNFNAIVGTQAVLLVVALALTIPLAAGDFDLSVGFNLGFTMSVLAVLTVHQQWPWPTAMVAAIAIGTGVGVVNAVLIVRLGVNAFVTTLGTGAVLNGLTLALTQGQTIGGIPNSLSNLSRATFLQLPLVAYYAFGLALILWYVFELTPLGRYLFFVGGNRTAARLLGVPVRRIRFGTFVFAAALSGVAGILSLGEIGASDVTVGPSFLLPAYSAAFLGATTIKPGRFNAWGTVVALYLLETAITGLELLGAPFWVEPLFTGVTLTLAVLFAQLASREPVE